MDKEHLLGLEEAIKDLTKELRHMHRDELLTTNEVCQEYRIGRATIAKMFEDPEFPVQTYMRPYRIFRSEFEKYCKKRHDNLIY